MSLEAELSIFLDSGAFSAWSRGSEVPLDDYIAFVQKYNQFIHVYANLDVIGDAEATWKNQERMEAAGLNPLPVYHVEDELEYLYRCLEYPYFCLGGMAKGSSRDRRIFLDKCWNIICDDTGLPGNKVHGFGLTAVNLLVKYPWYSVDSTAWVLTGANGGILVPKVKASGEYDFLSCSRIAVSSLAHLRSVSDPHIDNLSVSEREYVLDYIESEGYTLGSSVVIHVDKDYILKDGEFWLSGSIWEDGSKNIEDVKEVGVANDYKLRHELNAKAFLHIQDCLPQWPWAFKRSGTRRLSLL